jgi:uncharacterized protein YjiS (DUF1127 family)
MRTLLAWWLKMHRRHLANRQLRELAHLDARTLKDIGVQPWNSPVGARVEAMRTEWQRWNVARVGMY